MKKTNAGITAMAMTMLTNVTLATNNWTVGSDVTAVSLSGMNTTVHNVLGTMQWIGYIIAVGMLIWVGIKYVTSGAGEKAKVKETLVPIVIGAVLIAAAVTIATALFGAVSTK